MPQTISIGATQSIEMLKSRLGQDLKIFNGDGVMVDLEENPAGKFTFLACHLFDFRRDAGEEAQDAFKHIVADAISEIILNYWEDILLKDIIRYDYNHFGNDEKKLIYNYALRHINREGEDYRNTICWLNRKNEISQKLLDFLCHNNRIIIDGFIKFRLKEYVRELKEATGKAVDDFLLEKEYKEFIQLLKYFVEIQEPKIKTIHVLIKPGGVFKLYDNWMKPVKSDYLEGFAIDLADGEINYEDLLVSALITIAPEEITLHCKSGGALPTALETIKNVFEGRVNECAGCDLCVSSLKI